MTSFSDETNKLPQGNDWQVYVDAYKPGPGQKRFIPYNGNRRVNIGRNYQVGDYSVTDEGRNITVVNPGTFLEFLRVQLPLKEKTLDFTMKRQSQYSFVVSSNLFEFRQIGTGIEVEIKGVGKAWTRNVWRDSDVAKNIVKFVHTDCLDPFDEEALVWLVGALSKLIWFIYGV
jgi:hypothetical protein